MLIGRCSRDVEYDVIECKQMDCRTSNDTIVDSPEFVDSVQVRELVSKPHNSTIEVCISEYNLYLKDEC